MSTYYCAEFDNVFIRVIVYSEIYICFYMKPDILFL